MALEIVQILAAGTFGHVAVVRDSVSGLLFAAKVLKSEHLENVKLVRRMQDEAAMLTLLDHPNIVRTNGIRDIDGRPVVLLEWVRGVPLDALLVRIPTGLLPADACEITRVATAALHAAYNAVDPRTGLKMNLIHRDFKPSNVQLSMDGVVKVLDFGIAKAQFAGKQSETVTMVLGAHGYLAPERLDGADDDPSGDIYAIGCSLFELLTARRMKLSLHRESHDERLAKELMRLAPSGTSPRTRTELTELITAMCAYDPADRPSHAGVVNQLGRIVLGSGLAPDLERIARKHVIPHLELRSFTSPRGHPAFQELAFLETPTGATPASAPPRDSDVALRAFLSSPDWHRRREQLKRILASDPSWTAEPLLEVVERHASGRLFRRWRSDGDAREQLVVVLELLKARVSPAVVARLRPLLRHRDAEVCELARQIVAGTSGSAEP